MLYSFFKSIILGIFVLLGMLVATWVPTPCYNDAYSEGTPRWAWGKAGKGIMRPRFLPFLDDSFW